MLHSRSLSPRLIWLPMIALAIVGVLIQACSTTVNIEKGAVSLACGSDGTKSHPGGTDEGGCKLTGASGQVATGYMGIGGPNPVPPHTPEYTCSATSNKCTNPGIGGCNLTHSSYKCTNSFTYPATGTVGTCACPCL
jgi:hypothetical protein